MYMYVHVCIELLSAFVVESCPLCHYAKETLGKASKSCSDEKRGLFKHEVCKFR